MKCEGLNLNNNFARFRGTNVPRGGQNSYTRLNLNSPSQDNFQNNNASENKNAGSPLLSIGILQAVTIGLQKIAQLCAYKLSGGKEFADSITVKKIAENMKAKNALDTAIEYITPDNMSQIGSKYGINGMLGEVARGRNAFFMSSKRLAVAPEAKPSLILHELGHAINAKNPITRLLQNSRRYAGFAPAAILIASKLIPDKEDGKPSFIKKYGGVLGALAFLPTVIEEALASARGIRAAKGALGKTPAIKTLTKNYGLALATYIISGIILGISTKMAQKEQEAGIRPLGIV